MRVIEHRIQENHKSFTNSYKKLYSKERQWWPDKAFVGYTSRRSQQQSRNLMARIVVEELHIVISKLKNGKSSGAVV